MRQFYEKGVSRGNEMRVNPGSFPLIHVGNTTIQNGRACVEICLPNWPVTEGEKVAYILYLWDEKGTLVFQTCRPVAEEEPCVIQLLHPQLWEGAEKPYLYRLELYAEIKMSGEAADVRRTMKFLERRWLPIRTFCEIPGKGFFLNGHSFSPACVRIASPGKSDDREKNFMNLLQMGANILCVDKIWELPEPEQIYLQEACDRIGLLLWDNKQLLLEKNDTFVIKDLLFDCCNHPTEVYYQYKAMWSKEPFVYISNRFDRKPDGGYLVRVYSNCKRVVLLMNGVVFAFQEDGPEFVFQDLQVKAFPVWLSAEGDGCGMSVVCYQG